MEFPQPDLTPSFFFLPKHHFFNTTKKTSNDPGYRDFGTSMIRQFDLALFEATLSSSRFYLLTMDSLLATSESLFEQVPQHFDGHLSKFLFDAFHDCIQVCQVFAIAENIFRAESVSQPEIRFISTTVVLGTLLRYISGHKYVSEFKHAAKKLRIPLRFLRSIFQGRENASESDPRERPLLYHSCPQFPVFLIWHTQSKKSTTLFL